MSLDSRCLFPLMIQHERVPFSAYHTDGTFFLFGWNVGDARGGVSDLIGTFGNLAKACHALQYDCGVITDGGLNVVATHKFKEDGFNGISRIVKMWWELA